MTMGKEKRPRTGWRASAWGSQYLPLAKKFLHDGESFDILMQVRRRGAPPESVNKRNRLW